MNDTTTYSTYEVADLAGITYRQLDHWCRSGRLGPMEHPGTGKGRRLTPHHLAIATNLARLSRIPGMAKAAWPAEVDAYVRGYQTPGAALTLCSATVGDTWPDGITIELDPINPKENQQ